MNFGLIIRIRTETSVRGLTICWITNEAEGCHNPSPVKSMVIITYNVRGIIICHFVPHGSTVTAQYCRDFLVRLVRCGVRNKCPDIVNSGIILHDNVRPHKSECVRQVLRCWAWEESGHPPNSPDISPCEFDLILKVKEPIRDGWFAT
ncbi:uncharacterized protein TNIN_470011 [Trichonephila inaurata madagascariensis]|uniref:Transposase n=1 Tax=Trichonephila inaurata madagascariensis TaxID=2747483 RepID=A0A8X7CIG9_9ARAC|nr:uncharacterized protein TNIN_470011 [Trichonephila inaurata madagascariensis]